jgi:2-aminobenzoate-CoA ligase
VFEEWVAKTGKPILDGIGGTEMLHIYISNRFGDARPGSTGTPLTGYQAMVVDDDMNEVPRGTPGHLAVKGPVGCRYMADDRQQKFVRKGWNLPGDTFVQDAEGRFHFAARSDDMIVSSGYNIAGPEVEAALLAHPMVLECAVIGAPDEERGHIVEAHVVLAGGAEPSELTARLLQDYVKATIAPFKYPRRVVFCAALPKTESGKIQRFRLRTLPATAGSA